MIDLKSKVDVTSRMSPGQARKVLAEIFNHNPNLISFTKHAREQMLGRDLKSGDVLNVLKAGKIVSEPDLESGSFRYRVQTNKIIVVIAFKKPNHVVIVTAWRKD
jgi:hypothetical protein